jgi:transketolase
MRNAFADEITRLAALDERIVLLSGDIGNKLFDGFKERFPSRFYNCGVAEQNMIGTAAGLALSGLRPVVYTIAPFTTTRCYEQIRVDLCYHRAPVVIVGTGAGLSYAELGPTHHSLEDLAILRVLPEMTVLAPCDEAELRAGLGAALRLDGPAYMRIGKKGEPRVHPSAPDFKIGRAMTLAEGEDVCLIATGTVVTVANAAAEILRGKGLSVGVVSMPTVKPLDERCLERVFEQYRLVATIEEHSRIGGLGSAVAEWRTDASGGRARHVMFGADDEFMHVIGSQDYARAVNGIAAQSIALGCAGRLGVLIEV